LDIFECHARPNAAEASSLSVLLHDEDEQPTPITARLSRRFWLASGYGEHLHILAGGNQGIGQVAQQPVPQSGN
jgi:hypothetical protein